METNKEINENLYGCFSVGFFMFVLMVMCLMLALCSCKPQERLVEIEKWQHDTTTVVDTVRITEFITLHDSIFSTEYVTEYVKDSTKTDVAWKYYTYADNGAVASLLEYTSSTHQGKTAQKQTESASTSVSDADISKTETSGHSESTGHSEALQSKEQVKTGLTRWQRFIQMLGYVMLVCLALGIAFGGMRLYGKWKNL